MCTINNKKYDCKMDNNEYIFERPISKNSVIINNKCMLYKVCSVKNKNMWITNYHDDMHILFFKAFKSEHYKLSESDEHFLSTHRLISDKKFNQYCKKLEDYLNQHDIEISDYIGITPEITDENNDIIQHD